MKVKSSSRVQLLATPWTAAYQAPPSMGFSRQEYWSGLPLPSPKEKKGCINCLVINSYHLVTGRTIFSDRARGRRLFLNVFFLKIISTHYLVFRKKKGKRTISLPCHPLNKVNIEQSFCLFFLSFLLPPFFLSSTSPISSFSFIFFYSFTIMEQIMENFL